MEIAGDTWVKCILTKENLLQKIMLGFSNIPVQFNIIILNWEHRLGEITFINPKCGMTYEM